MAWTLILHRRDSIYLAKFGADWTGHGFCCDTFYEWRINQSPLCHCGKVKQSFSLITTDCVFRACPGPTSDFINWYFNVYTRAMWFSNFWWKSNHKKNLNLRWTQIMYLKQTKDPRNFYWTIDTSMLPYSYMNVFSVSMSVLYHDIIHFFLYSKIILGPYAV